VSSVMATVAVLSKDIRAAYEKSFKDYKDTVPLRSGKRLMRSYHRFPPGGPYMNKTKPAILQSYDDPIRSAYEAIYVTKTLTRFAATPRARLLRRAPDANDIALPARSVGDVTLEGPTRRTKDHFLVDDAVGRSTAENGGVALRVAAAGRGNDERGRSRAEQSWHGG
jgi:hypothetical protein